jgi:hypothetical protein
LGHDSALWVRGYFGSASPILVGVYQTGGKNQQEKLRERDLTPGGLPFLCAFFVHLTEENNRKHHAKELSLSEGIFK